MRLLLLFIALLAGPALALAAPAPADTLRPLSPERLLSYTYANDLFFRTDYYFTQGMTLRVVHPSLARWPTRHLLASGPAGSTQHYGFALRYDGFTPLRIQDASIRVGDRPYAAYGYASFFRVSTHPTRHRRLTTTVDLGFIGPAAGGQQLQTSIHRVTGNAEPRGWAYQIRNDAVLGYRVQYEQLLLAAPGRAELLGSAGASLGTLYTYASTGLRVRVGKLQPDFAELVPGPWQLYAEASAEIRLVGYDATLQGGAFNRSSPYVLAAGDVSRAVLRSAGGMVLAHRDFRFSATATWVAPEFAGARSHRWGELGLTRTF